MLRGTTKIPLSGLLKEITVPSAAVFPRLPVEPSAVPGKGACPGIGTYSDGFLLQNSRATFSILSPKGFPACEPFSLTRGRTCLLLPINAYVVFQCILFNIIYETKKGVKG
jgi:hypothetical protein